MLRLQFLRDENSFWFLDAFLGTIFFISSLLLFSKIGLKPELAAFLLLPGWFLKSTVKIESKLVFYAIAVLFIGGISYWVQGGLLASNANYALMYFNVDTPFTLMIAQSIQQSSEYPPKLLENEGMSLMYHYGYHIGLSFLSSISGLKIHVVHSLVLLPWMFFLQVGLIISIVKKVSGIKLIYAAACALLIWLSYQQYLFNYLNPNTLKNLIVLPNRYTALYPLGPSTFEGPFILAVIWLLWIKRSGAFLLSTILVILIPLFKIPLAPVVGMGFGLSALHFAWKEKKWVYLIYPSVAAVGMFVVFKLFSAAVSVAPPIEFFSMSHVQKDQWLSILIPIVILFLIHFLTKKKVLSNNNSWLLAFVFPMPILLLFINIQDVNTWQLIAVVPFTAWFISVLILVKNRELLKPIYKKGLIGLSVFILIIPISNAVVYVSNLLNTPVIGHEYCSNKLIEKTLKHIPLKENVIATNDLRYPAENFSRDGSQFQFSALFGHQMKVSDLSYLITLDFLKQALEFQSKLPQSIPSKEDLEFLKSKDVTHFVLAKSDVNLEGRPVVEYKTVVVK